MVATTQKTIIPQPSPTWEDSLVRAVTVGGLGTGLAVDAALTAGLFWHLRTSPYLLLAWVFLVIGVCGGGGSIFLDYVKRHVRLDPAWKSPAARVISGFAVLLYLFVFSAFLAVIMPLIPLVWVPYLKARRGESWRVRADTFIGEMLPRIAIF